MADSLLRFYHCLNLALDSSCYSGLNLKPKQAICLEKLYLGKDVLAVLPTGYGKSLIFHLLPWLFEEKRRLIADFSLSERCETNKKSIVIVISPLNSLIENQISRLKVTALKAYSLRFGRTEEQSTGFVVSDDRERKKLQEGYYNILYAHPEALVSCHFGKELLHSSIYRDNVCAIVVDEAHCILAWGTDFRKDYSQLGMVCAAFPNVPVIAMTATANRRDRNGIKESLGLRNCIEILGNLDRKNIFYEKKFREAGSDEMDSIESILKPISDGLLSATIDYPLTIIYLSLKWCGFAYRLFEFQLGISQYFPKGCLPLPENRLFAQYHSPQTEEMKDEILKQLTSPNSKVRVVFATMAIGMGVDIPSIRQIIHIGPPHTVREYFQETGRAGRDGKSSKAILFYNNRDIATNKPGMEENMRSYCQSVGQCLRVLLLKSLESDEPNSVHPGHMCCDVCKVQCTCFSCTGSNLGL